MSEQPRPMPNDHVVVQDELVELIKQRKQLGVERYNTVLQAGNGRDMLQDALEESLDLSIYLMGVKVAQELIVKVLTHVRDIHRPTSDERSCAVCADAVMTRALPYPCHTRCDVERVLLLLGVPTSNDYGNDVSDDDR